jgi:predicted nucleic acid-binding protein
VNGFTYDAGALIAAERDDRAMWVLHRRILERGISPTVPSPVLAQGWRGGPQANLSRFLVGCSIEGLNESEARAAGALLAKSKTSDIADACVAVGAMKRKDLVVTSDRGDIEHLARSNKSKISIRDI